MKLKRRCTFESWHWRRAHAMEARIWRLAFATCIATVLAGGCRLDMHIQPKYLPDKPTTFFSDGRSERPQIPGTVARGELRTDELMYQGTINGTPTNVFPFPITKTDLARGQQRFNIYCSPCHGYDGQGHGMIVLRGFQQPPSYDSPHLLNAPVGHFFQVMTNGFGNMYSYAARVSPADRWRIAAYIRVLQLSGHAGMNDVPASERTKLEANGAPAGNPQNTPPSGAGQKP